MELGIRLKNIREKKNLSQEHIGNELGIGQSAYSKIENNKRELTVRELYSLSKILESPILEILGENSEQSPFKNPPRVIIEVELTHDDIIKLGLNDRIFKQLK